MYHLTDAQMDLIKSGDVQMFILFLLVNNTNHKIYKDLQTNMMNSYSLTRNIFQQTVKATKKLFSTALTKRKARNRKKMRNQKRKKNYFSYKNRT